MALVGGSYNTTRFRPPHRGQRRRLSKRDKGKPRPRVHTNVSMSSSLRYVHSRLDFECAPSSRLCEQRTVTRHPSEKTSPMVSAAMRTKLRTFAAEVKRRSPKTRPNAEA